MKRKKTIKEDVEITGYAAEGKALAKLDGKVLFIEGAVPGDIADVLITRSKKDWGEGRATKIKEYSKDRVEPFCKHFGICGGCKWQMLPYELQLQYKQQEALQNLRRIGKVDLAATLPIIGGDETKYYRNKLEFTFSTKRYLTEEEINNLPPLQLINQLTNQLINESPNQQITKSPNQQAFGYHAPRIFDKIIDIEECWLMDDINNRLRNTIRDYALANDLSYYDIKNHSGWLRNVVIRFCTTGELMVNIILGHEDELSTNKLLDHLLISFPEITTLLYTINQKWNDTIYDLEPVVYYGPGYILEKLGDFTFKISPKSFFQTNTKQAEKLYTVAKDFCDLKGNETVYDLYCGTGSIGIFVSKDCQKIIGVDLVPQAIEDAKENARLNDLFLTNDKQQTTNDKPSAEFYAGDVIEICNDDFFSKHGKPDIIITDPPRAGMHEKLVKKLLEIAAPRIVYVSCNTATQARDINLLSERYTVTKVQPVDMFPHTHHIECVVSLELKQ
jgi:23S rRNA (uracil1939-C5)-methyltransferase